MTKITIKSHFRRLSSGRKVFVKRHSRAPKKNGSRYSEKGKQDIKRIIKEGFKEFDRKHNAIGNACVLDEQCYWSSEELQGILKRKGIQSTIVGGYYLNPSKEYVKKIEKYYGGDRTNYYHWWLETDRFVIDISNRMFHPANKNNLFLIYEKGKDKEANFYRQEEFK